MPAQQFYGYTPVNNAYTQGNNMMGYNSEYVQMNQQPYPTQPVQQQLQFQPYNQMNQMANQAFDTVAYVQGEAGAKGYMMGRNKRALLMDTEASVFYIKETDENGIPKPLTILDYTKRDSEQATSLPLSNNSKPIEYASKEDLKDMEEKFKSLEEKISELSKTRKVTKLDV